MFLLQHWFCRTFLSLDFFAVFTTFGSKNMKYGEDGCVLSFEGMATMEQHKILFAFIRQELSHSVVLLSGFCS